MNLGGSDRTRIRRFDLTPMIDVVLQLIIFFMFTSHLGSVSRTDVDLPRQPGERAVAEPSTIEIDLLRDGSVVLDGRPISHDRVARMVREAIDRAGGDASRVTVRVRPDRAGPAVHLNRLGARLAEVGLERLVVATEDPGGLP